MGMSQGEIGFGVDEQYELISHNIVGQQAQE